MFEGVGLFTVGVLANATTVVAVSPPEAEGAAYVPDSPVLRLPDGNWRYLPDHADEPVTVPAGDPDAARTVASARTWLAGGRVPGRTAEQRSAAARALLSIRALLRPNGAVAAGWVDDWKFSWPRDSSTVAGALAVTGHVDEAYRILLYSAETQRADGTWEARTRLDGSGPPDDRAWQLDANGWFPWSVWQWYQAAPTDTRDERLALLFPMVRKAAYYAANALDDRGLPPPCPDYWELPTTTVNIGTAAPLLSGLRAAAELGHHDAWRVAADRLDGGIRRHFGPRGYPRTIERPGADSAVAFLAPPFNQAPPDLAVALDRTYTALVQPNHGIIPGEDPTQRWPNSWTPATASLAVAYAGVGRHDDASRLLTWLLNHRTALGELPEQVDPSGAPVSVAPLAWTAALLLLGLAQLDGPLPAPGESR